MINRAADLIEQGGWDSPFELVMVDEMQDSSYARSRLVRALVAKPGRYLFSVGDDWQSINRFAGSDLSVMTRFTGWFGPAETVKLQRTFRSPQSVCDISGRFVSKNPEQITKKVESYQDEYEPPLRAVAVESDEEYTSVVTTYLRSLDRTAPAAGERPLVVYILGRYNRGRDKVQPALDRPWRRLTLTHRLPPFLLELIRDQDVTLESATGEPITVTPCPQCGEGPV